MSSSSTIICLVGSPCSGKSTISERLKTDGFNIINIGETLRKSKDAIIKETLVKGNYVSAEFIIPIIKSAFVEGTLIIDGFPRDKIQLEEYKREFPTIVTTYIHLQCPDEICILRAGKRNRFDDSDILQRLEKHHFERQYIEPLITIDANRQVDEIYKDVKNIIVCKSLH